ncbi:hypothetical protein [Roseibacillus persicicus]|uniref:hypothetical protein n=1 Tax=Roseibacillus persicicus TaxID=454148 RepID=UPI00280D4719|nr:hypothetical protein [Roseibacillus persicicus]MDQ8192649.1 hypothetical protein [Roseibacillus persicicus]
MKKEKLLSIIVIALLLNQAFSQDATPSPEVTQLKYVVSDEVVLEPEKDGDEIMRSSEVFKRTRLTRSEIAFRLNTLCSWSKGSKYYAYFNWMPKPFDPFNSLKDRFEEIAASKHGHYDRWGLADEKYGITMTVPEGDMFRTLPDNRGIFVRMDGIGGAVPIRGAQIFSNGFTNGLASRLMIYNLLKSTREFEQDGTLTDENESVFDPNVLDLQLEVQYGPGRNAFTNPENFKDVKDIASFDRAVEKLLVAHDLSAYGMSWGWQAASEIIAEKESGNEQYYDACIDLLSNRFSIREMGIMSSYTLSYLSGFSYGLNFEKEIKDGKPADVAAAATSRKGTEFEQNVKYLTNRLGRLILSGIGATRNIENLHTESSSEVTLEFASGWHKGLSNATSDVYQSVYKLSFSIGYDKGYQKGYDAGFAAGYESTYQVAYNAAFANFAGEINDLQGQIRKAEKENKKWFWGGAAVGGAIGVVAKFFTGGLF